MRLKNVSRSFRKFGVGLVELALALAVSALLVAGAVAYYNNANAERLTKEDTERLMALRSAVEFLYSGQPGYEGLTTAVLAKSGLLPRAMVKSPTQLVNVWGGNLTAEPHATNGRLIYISHNIPAEACVRLISSMVGPQITWVNGHPVRVNGQHVHPIPVDIANSVCINKRNRIHWDF